MQDDKVENTIGAGEEQETSQNDVLPKIEYKDWEGNSYFWKERTDKPLRRSQ